MEELNTMGHVKVDTPPIRPVSAAHVPPPSEEKDASRFRFPTDKDRPVAPPRRLTEADKQKSKSIECLFFVLGYRLCHLR